EEILMYEGAHTVAAVILEPMVQGAGGNTSIKEAGILWIKASGLWLAQAFGGHGVAPTAFAGELLASAIAEGDSRWREFSDYGLVSAFKPAALTL
ncbi:MAG: hypothetical protein ACTS6J_12550, partial [Burkholderiales bacterium]